MGGIIGSIFGNKQRKKAAQRANDFSERMSSTSYQRGMADMRKAGLNPILAYQQGGASSPIAQMPTLNNVGEGVVSDALTAKQTSTSAKLGKSSRMLMTEQATKLGTAAAVDRATAEKVTADARMSNIQANIEATRIPRAILEMGIDTGNTGKALALQGRHKETFSIQSWLKRMLDNTVNSAKSFSSSTNFRETNNALHWEKGQGLGMVLKTGKDKINQ